MIYTTGSRRFVCKGNDGTLPPRTAGMKAKTDGPLLPMYRAGLLARLFGRT
jgi:hypothetical protein